MNEIKIKVKFKKGLCYSQGIKLVQNDYNSTKLVFEFDDNEGTKIFELRDSDDNVILADEIVNNELILARFDEQGKAYPIFTKEGEYIYEVSLYKDNSKLTSAYDKFKVNAEQVVIDGEIVETYTPMFDNLLSDLVGALQETDNIDIDVDKVGNTSTVTITKKDGQQETVQILDGETGNGIATIQKTSTSGLIDTYTITYTDGNMSTFNITNGKDGDVTQEQLDVTNSHLDYLSKLSNLFEKITATGTNITLNNTSDTILKIGLNANDLTQDGSPSPSDPQNIHVIKGNNEIKISNYETDEEYKYPINLGDIEICKIGDYQDVLFKNTLNSEYYDSSLELNKWYKLARIRKLELNISDMDNSEDYPGWEDVPNLRNDFPNASSGIQVYTTAYKCNIAVSGIYLNTLGNNSILYLRKSFFGLTQTQWKNTYPNLVFELYYSITTPTYTLLNDTLQTQLDNLQYALAYDTQTNISQTNTDLPFIIDAETYAKINVPNGTVQTFSQYSASADTNIISKGTLENVLRGYGIID